MKPDETAIYERARRLANLSLWTIDMQRRRINSDEPEDDKFVLRKWADFHFLIVALTRLRRSAVLATKAKTIEQKIKIALKEFDSALPNIKKMRDVAEHIDDYAVDSGKDKNISRKSLEVGIIDGETWHWLGFEINTKHALKASSQLFKAIKESRTLFKKEA